MNLTELANLHNSDKGNRAGEPPHKYTYLYDLLFHPLRSQPINLLEMGLAVGGPELGGPVDRRVTSPSVNMWLSYFPNARIYGFDISDFSHMEHPRFTFIRGDSGSAGDLQRLSQAAPHFDIIIDDASHASYHQQLALRVLWDRVTSGGLYIIEDLHWQSPAFEDVLPQVPKTASLLLDLFEHDRYPEHNVVLDASALRLLRGQVESFSAFSGVDGTNPATKMIVLRKG